MGTSETTKDYSGSSLTELCKGHDPWGFYIPPVSSSKYHKVLYELPLNPAFVPQPHIPTISNIWDTDHVKMPFSNENVFYSENNSDDIAIPKWAIICKVLQEPIISVAELETAIRSYNGSIPHFSALKYFLEEVLEEEESDLFFEILLPKIVKLALSLPELLPAGLPLLKKHHNRSVSLSRQQIASLLANAFLCTFPWTTEVSSKYPGVNFHRLFASHNRAKRNKCVIEKLKCLFHYFRIVTKSVPLGVITFERIYLPRNRIPRWDTLENNLGNTRVHIVSEGTIEDDGLGFLQVDFANKNVGGGVLGYGCVQEEIRFLICPELLVSRLFVEQLDDTEAVVIRGVERFSKYKGYGDTFEWDGNFIDNTPLDNYGRRQTAIAIIDATCFFKTAQQYYPAAVLRELSKAYVGFYSHHTDNLAPVATGNWGCGAFRGEPKLKALIQLMACNATHRDLVYYTFGNTELQEMFYNMYLFIASNKITMRELWRIFCNFAAKKLPEDKFYCFIQQSCFDNRNKPEMLITTKQSPKKKLNLTSHTQSSTNTDETQKATTSKYFEKTESSTENSKKLSLSPELFTSDEDVDPAHLLPSDHEETKKADSQKNFNDKLFEENHNEILSIFSILDGPPMKNNEGDDETLLSACDKLGKIRNKQVKNEGVEIEQTSMDVDEPIKEPPPKVTKSKNRITDYFSRLGKS